MLAPFATLLVLAGTLVILGCNALSTQLFLGPAPRGDRGVGLIVPFAAMAIAGLIVTAGALLASLRSDRPIATMVPLPAPLVGVASVVVTIGVTLAAIAALGMWAEPASLGGKGQALRAAVGWLVGLVGPALLGVVLLADLWMTPEAFRAHFMGKLFARGAAWALPLLALIGWGAAIALIGPTVGISWRRSFASAAHDRSERASLRDRLRTTPLVDLLREDLARLPSDAPFTAYSAYCVGSPVDLDDACKALLAERILAIPDWSTQMSRTLSSVPYDERWGAIEFVRQVAPSTFASHEAEFARGIEECIVTTADDIARRPGWLTEPYDRNFDGLGLVQSLIGAAKRFDGREAEGRVSEAMRALSREAATLKRDRACRKLNKVLEAAGFPVPQENTT